MAEVQASTVEQVASGTDRVIVAAEYPHLSPQRLFQAFTDASLLTQWWSPAATTEPKQGGVYHIWWAKLGKNLRGSYREFEPGQRLVMTWKWDEEPETPERTVEIDFAPSEAGTGARLTLTHGFYEDTEAGAEERRGILEGWLYFLPMLDKVSAA